MDLELLILFSIQESFMDLTVYENEFETMRLLFDHMPQKKRDLFVEKSSLKWLQDLEKNEKMKYQLKNNSEKIQESKDLRQQGNNLFTAKGDKRSILGACRLYNDAIYAALDTNSVELALGFANRGMALQAFGYYQQAYDDCVCALKFGYPETLRHKIVIRQAYCSLKMKDLSRAEKHLNELQKLPIRDGFSQQLKELLKTFDELKHEMADGKEKSNAVKEISLNRETQEIITTTNGRCMQAKCPIQRNELVFTERASAIVAVGDTRRMCHQCGTVNFIPIPCLNCRGRVNYCSLKCQKEHIPVHDCECHGYRILLFEAVGIAHLALRIVLDNGLYSILDELNLDHKSSNSEVWRRLAEGGEVWKNNSIQYAESLRMLSHLNKMQITDIKMFALMSYQLVVYLKYYTKYFKVLNAKNKNIDWELLTGALILRHIGQSICNAHVLFTIIPRPLTLTATANFHMLNETVWSSPWHIKLGYLHFFSHCNEVASINLPYLSLCNHSCVQMLRKQFSGRLINTYAMRNLIKGEEITNCYDLDYRKSRRATRCQRLREKYYFECECENCRQKNIEDVEYNKFNQYRCDNNNCRQIFIPMSENLVLDLFQSDDINDNDIYCSICGHKQNFNWYSEFRHLMSIENQASVRRRLYQIFKESGQYLVELNETRCFIAQTLVKKWFNLPHTTCPLNDQDYFDLIEIIKYILSVRKNEDSVNSIPYIIYMIYLWDLIAKGKYKCPKADMDEMIWALSIIADDLKVIFLNYYNDYIKDYYSS